MVVSYDQVPSVKEAEETLRIVEEAQKRTTGSEDSTGEKSQDHSDGSIPDDVRTWAIFNCTHQLGHTCI